MNSLATKENEKIRQEFSNVIDIVIELTNKISNIVIVDKPSQIQAIELAKTGRKVMQTIDNKRKEFTAPILAYKKEIDEFAKKLTNDLEQATEILRKQILEFELTEIENEQCEVDTKNKEFKPQEKKITKSELNFKVIDLGQVPREFFILDETKIKNAMKAGIKIPGIEYFEVKSLILR